MIDKCFYFDLQVAAKRVAQSNRLKAEHPYRLDEANESFLRKVVGEHPNLCHHQQTRRLAQAPRRL